VYSRQTIYFIIFQIILGNPTVMLRAGTVTAYWLDDRGSIPDRDRNSVSPDKFWGPPSLLFNGYRRLFPQTKQPKREANHSPQSSTCRG